MLAAKTSLNPSSGSTGLTTNGNDTPSSARCTWTAPSCQGQSPYGPMLIHHPKFRSLANFSWCQAWRVKNPRLRHNLSVPAKPEMGNPPHSAHPDNVYAITPLRFTL